MPTAPEGSFDVILPVSIFSNFGPQNCPHTCNECAPLSGRGGSLQAHMTNPSRHPVCNVQCPGHPLLQVKTLSPPKIRALLVLPHDVKKSDMSKKSWPNTSFIQHDSSPEREFWRKITAIPISGFNHACHFVKGNGYIYHWVSLWW
jgi:hypothetical protein